MDAASTLEKRTTQRRSERLEKAAHGVRVTSATAQGFMKRSLAIPRAKTTSDVSSAIQMIEELVGKYEEAQRQEIRSGTAEVIRHTVRKAAVTSTSFFKLGN